VIRALPTRLRAGDDVVFGGVVSSSTRALDPRRRRSRSSSSCSSPRARRVLVAAFARYIVITVVVVEWCSASSSAQVLGWAQVDTFTTFSPTRPRAAVLLAGYEIDSSASAAPRLRSAGSVDRVAADRPTPSPCAL